MKNSNNSKSNVENLESILNEFTKKALNCVYFELEDSLRYVLKELEGNITQFLNRPSIAYQAKLYRTGQNTFQALNNEIILGRGKTPNEAMKDFDRAWVEGIGEVEENGK